MDICYKAFTVTWISSYNRFTWFYWPPTPRDQNLNSIFYSFFFLYISWVQHTHTHTQEREREREKREAKKEDALFTSTRLFIEDDIASSRKDICRFRLDYFVYKDDGESFYDALKF